MLKFNVLCRKFVSSFTKEYANYIIVDSNSADIGPFDYRMLNNYDVVKRNFCCAVDYLNGGAYDQFKWQIKNRPNIFLCSFFNVISKIPIEVKIFDSFFDFFTKKYFELYDYYETIGNGKFTGYFVIGKISEKITESILEIIETKEE